MPETFATTLEQLAACPPDVAGAPGLVCIPNPDVGDAAFPYTPVHRDDLFPCPPELDGPGAVCYDRVVDYLPFSPDDIVPCPPELGAAPGKACAELHSKTTEEELLAMIADSPVTNLRVHVIGLGDREDHEFLRLLAAAGNGEYIYCSARGCDSP